MSAYDSQDEWEDEELTALIDEPESWRFWRRKASDYIYAEFWSSKDYCIWMRRKSSGRFYLTDLGETARQADISGKELKRKLEEFYASHSKSSWRDVHVVGNELKATADIKSLHETLNLMKRIILFITDWGVI